MDARSAYEYHGARIAPVAQLDRVLPSEGRGRGFESRLVRHTQYEKASVRRDWGFFVGVVKSGQRARRNKTDDNSGHGGGKTQLFGFTEQLPPITNLTTPNILACR